MLEISQSDVSGPSTVIFITLMQGGRSHTSGPGHRIIEMARFASTQAGPGTTLRRDIDATEEIVDTAEMGTTIALMGNSGE